MVRTIVLLLGLLCVVPQRVNALDLELNFSHLELGVNHKDIDQLECRNKQLWWWQTASLMPWDASHDDTYLWQNQFAETYVEFHHRNMLEWLSCLSVETYNENFDFLRVRVLYARQQSRQAQLRKLLGQQEQHRVLPVHQHQAINRLYGPNDEYSHEPHNGEIAHIHHMEETFLAFAMFLKLTLASVMWWLNFALLYGVHRSISVHARPH